MFFSFMVFVKFLSWVGGEIGNIDKKVVRYKNRF